MKPSHTGWILPILILLMPLLALGGWELLQRHRFTAEAERLDVAIRGFAASAAYPGEDGKPLPTASGRSSFPFFAVQTSSQTDWTTRLQVWSAGAVFLDSGGQWYPVRVEIGIAQSRKLLMSAPQIHVVWTRSEGKDFRPSLSQSLKDFKTIDGPFPP